MAGTVFELQTEDGRVLPGAVFELQDEKGNTLQKGLTTNESGRLEINDLVPGKYQLVETEAPTGYEIDATPIVFTVEKGKKDPVQLTKKNKVIPGSLLLTKVDSKNRKALAGAIFELQDQTGKVLQDNLVTDNFGRLAVANLQAGKYQLVETQAPKGYKLGSTRKKGSSNETTISRSRI
ncbi:MSCRAMM family protein [Enterococcus faecalis]|uniref:MSCRAMM family protein n=1 Tax=Enterococcus TaxID=1350 RepID=UPI000B09B897|nr:SpaA isopeptide-forming pilin-related protein [Enterococcus faecalis]